MLQRLILEDLYLDLEFLHSSILYKRNSYCDWLQRRVQDFFIRGRCYYSMSRNIFIRGRTMQNFSAPPKKILHLGHNTQEGRLGRLYNYNQFWRLPPMPPMHGQKHTMSKFIRGICPLCPTAGHASNWLDKDYGVWLANKIKVQPITFCCSYFFYTIDDTRFHLMVDLFHPLSNGMVSA